MLSHLHVTFRALTVFNVPLVGILLVRLSLLSPFCCCCCFFFAFLLQDLDFALLLDLRALVDDDFFLFTFMLHVSLNAVL